MTSLLAYLDGLPVGPLALFAAGYLALLLTVLAWVRSRRAEERCARCGGTWKHNPNGSSYHFCVPPRHRRPA
ncbi:MAG: hypothetical protein RJA59_2071 [Pseudomonadota bacterium]